MYSLGASVVGGIKVDGGGVGVGSILQAKFIEKNKELRNDRKIADLSIHILLVTLQNLFSECCPL